MHLFVVKTKTDFFNFKDLIPKLESVEDHKLYDSLFVFNPNTLNDEGWVLLGLSSKQLSIFRNYLISGVVFYTKVDLQKCYAITDDFMLIFLITLYSQ